MQQQLSSWHLRKSRHLAELLVSSIFHLCFWLLPFGITFMPSIRRLLFYILWRRYVLTRKCAAGFLLFACQLLCFPRRFCNNYACSHYSIVVAESEWYLHRSPVMRFDQHRPVELLLRCDIFLCLLNNIAHYASGSCSWSAHSSKKMFCNIIWIGRMF